MSPRAKTPKLTVADKADRRRVQRALADLVPMRGQLGLYTVNLRRGV